MEWPTLEDVLPDVIDVHGVIVHAKMLYHQMTFSVLESLPLTASGVLICREVWLYYDSLFVFII